MKYCKKNLVLLLLIVISTVNVFSRDSTKTKSKNLFWVSAGFGIYAGGFSVNYLHNKNLFMGRCHVTLNSDDKKNAFTYVDESVLYGRNFINKNRDILLSASIGLGIINITEGDFLGSSLVRENLLNVPIEAQIIFIPFT